MIYNTEIPLNDNVTAILDVEFVVTRRIPATYLDPPEGGDLQIQGFILDYIEGDGYFKTFDDLTAQGWVDIIADLIWSQIDMLQDGWLGDQLYDYWDRYA